MKIIVTGAAGFIGAAVSARLLERGDEVVGIDNLNEYYDVSLKKARIDRLAKYKNFKLFRLDIKEGSETSSLFEREQPHRVINLAAQAGVRDSVDNPHIHVNSNLVGFTNILEGCKKVSVQHLVYASSSTVYGAGTKLPFSEHDPAEHPISLYGATKRANELLAHAYSSLFGLATTGVRFFTTYGPWGRPDLAIFKFVRCILDGEAIDLYNNGLNCRDFVFIDDVVECVIRALDKVAEVDISWSGNAPSRETSYAPYRIYNIGSGQQIQINDLIKIIEQCLGMKAVTRLIEDQPGDVRATQANVDLLEMALGYRPQVGIKTGIRRFISWYLHYYQSKKNDVGQLSSEFGKSE